MNSKKLIPGQLYLLYDNNSYFQGCIVQYNRHNNFNHDRDLAIIYDPISPYRKKYNVFPFSSGYYSNLISLGTTELIEKINKL